MQEAGAGASPVTTPGECALCHTEPRPGHSTCMSGITEAQATGTAFRLRLSSRLGTRVKEYTSTVQYSHTRALRNSPIKKLCQAILKKS